MVSLRNLLLGGAYSRCVSIAMVEVLIEEFGSSSSSWWLQKLKSVILLLVGVVQGRWMCTYALQQGYSPHYGLAGRYFALGIANEEG